MNFDDIIWEHELAQLAGLSVAALRKWRAKGYGPIGFRLGRRVGYSRSDVATFLSGLRANSQ